MGFMDKVKGLFGGRGGSEPTTEGAEELTEPAAQGPGGAAPTTTPSPTAPAEAPPGDDAPPGSVT